MASDRPVLPAGLSPDSIDVTSEVAGVLERVRYAPPTDPSADTSNTIAPRDLPAAVDPIKHKLQNVRAILPTLPDIHRMPDEQDAEKKQMLEKIKLQQAKLAWLQGGGLKFLADTAKGGLDVQMSGTALPKQHIPADVTDVDLVFLERLVTDLRSDNESGDATTGAVNHASEQAGPNSERTPTGLGVRCITAKGLGVRFMLPGHDAPVLPSAIPHVSVTGNDKVSPILADQTSSVRSVEICPMQTWQIPSTQGDQSSVIQDDQAFPAQDDQSTSIGDENNVPAQVDHIRSEEIPPMQKWQIPYTQGDQSAVNQDHQAFPAQNDQSTFIQDDDIVPTQVDHVISIREDEIVSIQDDQVSPTNDDQISSLLDEQKPIEDKELEQCIQTPDRANDLRTGLTNAENDSRAFPSAFDGSDEARGDEQSSPDPFEGFDWENPDLHDPDVSALIKASYQELPWTSDEEDDEHDDDGAIDDDPATVEDPVPIVEDPVSVAEEPCSVVEKPVHVVEEQAPVVEDPVRVVEERVHVVEERVAVVEESVHVAGASASIQAPAPLEEPVSAGKSLKRPLGGSYELPPRKHQRTESPSTVGGEQESLKRPLEDAFQQSTPKRRGIESSSPVDDTRGSLKRSRSGQDNHEQGPPKRRGIEALPPASGTQESLKHPLNDDDHEQPPSKRRDTECSSPADDTRESLKRPREEQDAHEQGPSKRRGIEALPPASGTQKSLKRPLEDDGQEQQPAKRRRIEPASPAGGAPKSLKRLLDGGGHELPEPKRRRIESASPKSHKDDREEPSPNPQSFEPTSAASEQEESPKRPLGAIHEQPPTKRQRLGHSPAVIEAQVTVPVSELSDLSQPEKPHTAVDEVDDKSDVPCEPLIQRSGQQTHLDANAEAPSAERSVQQNVIIDDEAEKPSAKMEEIDELEASSTHKEIQHAVDEPGESSVQNVEADDNAEPARPISTGRALTDWNSQKVVDLRRALRRRDLPQGGVKRVLAQRLTEYEIAENAARIQNNTAVDDAQPTRSASNEPALTDWSSMKVVELRAKLAARGLDVKGVKAVLVRRLTEAESAHNRAIGEAEAEAEAEVAKNATRNKGKDKAVIGKAISEDASSPEPRGLAEEEASPLQRVVEKQVMAKIEDDDSSAEQFHNKRKHVTFASPNLDVMQVDTYEEIILLKTPSADSPESVDGPQPYDSVMRGGGALPRFTGSGTAWSNPESADDGAPALALDPTTQDDDGSDAAGAAEKWSLRGWARRVYMLFKRE